MKSKEKKPTLLTTVKRAMVYYVSNGGYYYPNNNGCNNLEKIIDDIQRCVSVDAITVLLLENYELEYEEVQEMFLDALSNPDFNAEF